MIHSFRLYFIHLFILLKKIKNIVLKKPFYINMNLSKFDEEVVFIVGCGKSGNTLLSSLIHKNIKFREYPSL